MDLKDNDKKRQGLPPPAPLRQHSSHHPQHFPRNTVLSSMRRHLPKVAHTHLDAMADWTRFKATKRSERLQQVQQAQAQQQSQSSAKTFRVQMPARLLVWTCGIFLVIPLSLFGWKELHMAPHEHVQHLRDSSVAAHHPVTPGHIHSQVEDAHWIEDHLYNNPKSKSNSNSASSASASASAPRNDTATTTTTADAKAAPETAEGMSAADSTELNNRTAGVDGGDSGGTVDVAAPATDPSSQNSGGAALEGEPPPPDHPPVPLYPPNPTDPAPGGSGNEQPPQAGGEA